MATKTSEVIRAILLCTALSVTGAACDAIVDDGGETIDDGGETIDEGEGSDDMAYSRMGGCRCEGFGVAHGDEIDPGTGWWTQVATRDTWWSWSYWEFDFWWGCVVPCHSNTVELARAACGDLGLPGATADMWWSVYGSASGSYARRDSLGECGTF